MLRTDGVFLLVSVLSMPKLNAVESANAKLGRWQLAQLTEESFDKNFSLNNISPSFILRKCWDSSSIKEIPIKPIMKINIIDFLMLFIIIKLLIITINWPLGCNFPFNS